MTGLEMFLNGRVVVEQPARGFRSGLDAVMLAAAVPARAGQTVLELGAGAGTAGLCLMARVKDLRLTGVEIDPEMAALARKNASANAVSAEFVAADIFHLPSELKRDFDQVLCNPPFHEEDNLPPDPTRARALMDGARLGDWLKTGLQRTVSGGFFTAILRADRLPEAMEATGGRGTAIVPLWPTAGAPAKRAVLRIRKGSKAPFALLPGLVLHRPDGGWSDEAEAVLRGGAALALPNPGP